ncbi:MAG: HAMP domain-containing histidine kinase [Deltaproteobacteria bacterium]|nr:HAMP domain-containing histidine kinase [Deltaproteobacteria bacterium]
MSLPRNHEMTARRRLALSLVFFLVALLVPFTLLLLQTYTRLEDESFLLYRAESDAVFERMSNRIRDIVNGEEARSFESYSFFDTGLTKQPIPSQLPRSTLSAYPIVQDVPGVLGYFQIDSNGSFTSPSVPSEAEMGAASLPADALQQRRALLAELRSRISPIAHQLSVTPVHSRAPRVPLEGVATYPQRDSDLMAESSDSLLSRSRTVIASTGGDVLLGGLGGRAADSSEVVRAKENKPASNIELAKNAPQKVAQAKKQIAELEFDSAILQRQEPAMRADAAQYAGAAPPESKDYRSSRRTFTNALVGQKLEVSSEAASSGAASNELGMGTVGASDKFDAPEPEQRVASAPIAESNLPLEIVRRESEIAPIQILPLNDTEMVFYRRVWQPQARFVQGFIVNRQQFFQSVLDSALTSSTLSSLLRATFGLSGEVFLRLGTPMSADGKRELLLLRAFLPPPFDGVETIFSLSQLPPAPGKGVVNSLVGIFALFLTLGVFGLYRLGVRHIRLAQERSDFVSAVSHELKTPLTSIRMYSEMLREGWVESEEKKRSYYDYIFHESERLSRLIANVLQLARLTRHNEMLQRRSIPTLEAFETICKKVRSQVENAGFTLEIVRDIPGDEPVGNIEIEEDAFLRIFINLIDNAMKFSAQAPQRTIILSLRIRNRPAKTAIFSVRDFGPGVPPAQMKKIFQLFYRGESELSRSTTGTGIGLALVSELAANLGGSVDVETRDPGAEFSVHLPVRDAVG